MIYRGSHSEALAQGGALADRERARVLYFTHETDRRLHWFLVAGTTAEDTARLQILPEEWDYICLLEPLCDSQEYA